MILKQSQTAKVLMFLMIDSSDHITPKTGLSPTVTLSKNGGAFASCAGAITEVANGWYKVAGNATDTATLGPLILHATGTGADPVDVVNEVVGYDPDLQMLLPTTAGRTLDVSAAGEAGLDWANIGGSTTTQALSGTTVAVATSLTNNIPGGTVTVGGYLAGQIPLQPTVAGRTLDVSTTGEAGIDFANIGSPTTTNDLSGTSVKLRSNGLDSISLTRPSAIAATFRDMILLLYYRFFGKATMTASQIKNYAVDGTTVVSTQTVSDDGTTQTQGEAS